jgi:predicted GNAT family acetyltransferase
VSEDRPAALAPITVSDNPSEHRVEVRLGDELGGFVVYRRKPGLVAFIHTEIDPRFEGHGLGSTLIGAVLDAARADGEAVLPFCPFVNAYIERHSEYVDLVPASQREAFGL